ncbi:hypothetical protein D3C81_1550280 [compost metagenome]
MGNRIRNNKECPPEAFKANSLFLNHQSSRKPACKSSQRRTDRPYERPERYPKERLIPCFDRENILEAFESDPAYELSRRDIIRSGIIRKCEQKHEKNRHDGKENNEQKRKGNNHLRKLDTAEIVKCILKTR